MAHAALVGVWGDNHKVSQVRDAFHQVADARCGDAVVVGDEDQRA